MSLTNRNDRSIHTDAKNIKRSLTEHAKWMAIYEAQGMSRDEASKKAFKRVTGKIRDCVTGSDRGAITTEVES